MKLTSNLNSDTVIAVEVDGEIVAPSGNDSGTIWTESGVVIK